MTSYDTIRMDKRAFVEHRNRRNERIGERSVAPFFPQLVAEIPRCFPHVRSGIKLVQRKKVVIEHGVFTVRLSAPQNFHL